jgi:hypothetical protein
VYVPDVSHCALRAAFCRSWRTESASSNDLVTLLSLLLRHSPPLRAVAEQRIAQRFRRRGIFGSESVPFTLAYLKLSSILNGTRMNATCADPSAAWARGSQKPSAIQPVIDGHALEVRAHGRENRLDRGGWLVVVLVVRRLFVDNLPDVHLDRHSVRGAHELTRAHVEPERPNRQPPVRPTWLDAKLPERDDLPSESLNEIESPMAKR